MWIGFKNICTYKNNCYRIFLILFSYVKNEKSYNKLSRLFILKYYIIHKFKKVENQNHTDFFYKYQQNTLKLINIICKI